MKTWILELWHYRELLWAFTLKEIKIRYKQTILGTAWAILQPAALTIIFSLIFGLFLRIDSQGVPFIVFYYSALLPWTFVTTSISFGSLSVTNNSGLVTKVYFPREILPFSTIGAAFFDLLMGSVIFIFLMLLYGITFSPSLIFIAIIAPTLLILTSGISLILSSINVLFRDVKFVVPLVLQIWLYASPIIYTIDRIPDSIRKFYIFNPVAPLIQSFRDVTVLGRDPNFKELSLAILLSILIFLVGYLFFKRKERIFADVI